MALKSHKQKSEYILNAGIILGACIIIIFLAFGKF